MNYLLFEELCKINNTTPTALSKKIGLSKGNTSNWKSGGNPSVDILCKIADELNCTTDALLGRKEYQTTTLSIDEQELLEHYRQLAGDNKKEVSARAEELAKETASKQNSDKQRLVKMYDLLTDIEKGEILGELKAMTKNRNPDIHIQTVRVAARSTDNAPPRMVTGDFSDILNAPDATDEY